MADAKITALTANTTPALTDILPMVDDPGGTPVTQKITLSNLLQVADLPVKSLKFPATQVPSSDANSLDDYEEGTWTPTATFGTPGNLSVVYSEQVGRYTKIGRMVFYTARILTSSFLHTTASGTFTIAGLPFTCANVTAGYWTAGGRVSGWTKAGWSAPMAIVLYNATTMFVQVTQSGSAASSLTTTEFPTGSTVDIIISGGYETA